MSTIFYTTSNTFAYAVMSCTSQTESPLLSALLSVSPSPTIWKCDRFQSIYPSQRQNLLLTLEIITHNLQNFQKIQNFGIFFKNLEFFVQNFQNHKGAANDIKGAAASLLVNSKISIFN